MNVTIEKLNNSDIGRFDALISLFEVVFEMKGFKMPGIAYLQRLLEKEGFYVFVALVDGRVVGGLTAYALEQYYSTKPLVYVYDLAVDTALQRKGIGKLLMTGITDYCKRIGVEEVFVQADLADTHAVEFYHSTGATAEDVIHFYYPLNMD